MKKIVIILFLGVMAFPAICQNQGREEKKWSFGPKIGASVYLLREAGFRSAQGYSIGGFVRLKKKWFAFKPEISYSYQHNLFDWDTKRSEYTSQSHFVQVGVICGFYPWKGLNLETGPIFDLPFYREKEDVRNHHVEYDRPLIKAAWVFGIGYDFPCGLIIGGRYTFGKPVLNPKIDGGNFGDRRYATLGVLLGWAF